MFQAIADTIFTSKDKEVGINNSNVNTNPRSKKDKKEVGKIAFSEVDFKRQQEQIEELLKEIEEKDAVIKDLMTSNKRKTNSNSSASQIAGEVVQRKHEISAHQHVITDRGRSETRLGTRGSISTTAILEALVNEPIEKSEGKIIAEKFLRIFQNPVEYANYLQSPEFASDIVAVAEEVSAVYEGEPRCLSLQSPVYVFGDIHGNLEDLHFFADNIWKLGMDLTAGYFLFLGDYVDRGLNCLECVAYLFGLKLLYPKKIFMLRGNHETRDVNGWEEHYGERSFLYQCKDRFGVELGELVWEECNSAFDRLPLACVIDKEIFCIHGGIPRIIEQNQNELDAILSVPAVSGVMPAYRHETNASKQVAADCIWSDPASDIQENTLNADGFGESARGGGAVCFGHAAIDNFLARNQLSYIIRAHEAHALGVAVSKGARVFTVFSTSKDHRQGSQAMAGCILVDGEKIQVINRSPKYRNRYVHRRTSISLENLSNDEIESRRKLGLIRNSIADADYYQMKAEMDEEERQDNKTQTQRVSFAA